MFDNVEVLSRVKADYFARLLQAPHDVAYREREREREREGFLGTN